MTILPDPLGNTQAPSMQADYLHASLVTLLTYASEDGHSHSRIWIPAILTILARLALHSVDLFDAEGGSHG